MLTGRLLLGRQTLASLSMVHDQGPGRGVMRLTDRYHRYNSSHAVHAACWLLMMTLWS